MGRHIHLGFPQPLQSTVVRCSSPPLLTTATRHKQLIMSFAVTFPLGSNCLLCQQLTLALSPLGRVPQLPTPARLTNTKRPIPCFCFPRYGHLVPTHFLQRMQEAVSSEKKRVEFFFFFSFYLFICIDFCAVIKFFVETKMAVKQHAGLLSYCTFFHADICVHLEAT